ncbi:hypothetical protein RMATCC62417_04939 [Rhizopus microsporus]|nr:hypothetical protein RMATCC62417_04939 [Rhizopus microsporus]
MTENLFERIDKQSESPYPVWALSAFNLATVPASFRNAPGLPHPIVSIAFSAIFAGAGYVVNTGDSDNGSGIATAWGLSWAFLHAKKAILSRKPLPLALLGAVTVNTYVYGKKTLKVNGYL